MTVIDTIKNSLGASGSAPEDKKSAVDDKLPDLPDTEVFDHDKVTVVFVLGGPGAGACSLEHDGM